MPGRVNRKRRCRDRRFRNASPEAELIVLLVIVLSPLTVIDACFLTMMGPTALFGFLIDALLCAIIVGGVVGATALRLKVAIGVLFGLVALLSLLMGFHAGAIEVAFFSGLFGIGALPIALPSAWLLHKWRTPAEVHKKKDPS